MWIGNRFIPRNTTIVGSGRVQGERLEIEITSIECEGSIYDVEWQVYDSDGQEGINIPQSMENDALHEIGPIWAAQWAVQSTSPPIQERR